MAGRGRDGGRPRRVSVFLRQRLPALCRTGAKQQSEPGRRDIHRRLRHHRGPVLRLQPRPAQANRRDPDRIGYSRIDIAIKVSGLRFTAHLETTLAPKSCEAFRSMLPMTTKLIQARWSGEAAW